MKYDKQLLCKRLKEIRISRYKKDEKYSFCKSQESFAEKLEVERRTISNWERGNTLPPLSNLIDICNILDCNIEYFLGADELPYIDSISKVCHFTNIKPEIISFAMENSDYLDCLNFFMLPKTCSELFNQITLTEWKKYWINESLNKIKSHYLLNLLRKIFNKFYFSMPTTDTTQDKFKKFLYENIHEEMLNFTELGDSNKNCIYVRSSLSYSGYQDFKSKCDEDNLYKSFIDFICSICFKSFLIEIHIDLQKKNISDKFLIVLDKYLHYI